MSENPYATSESAIAVPPPVYEGAEAIRQQYLKHEANIKSIGTLYLFGSVVVFVASLLALNENLTKGNGQLFEGVFFGGVAVLQFFVGRGIRKLQKWARALGIVFSCLGLLGFPVGTLISAYVLWLLTSQKGAYVFSPEYKQVIADTPHIKYKSRIVTLVLVTILVVIVLAVAAFFIARLMSR